jgi:hypothetical protein
VKTKKEEWHGYKTIVVTATDDWSVRDVVGGISPRLDGVSKNLTYDIRYGALTQAVLQNYAHTDGGKRLPVDRQHPQRQEYIDKSGWRYRGVWLVIDEFNRAHIDTAFGSLLTTLSGGPRAALLVPSREQDSDEIPMPADFRIIGTLNSFDRHFLNQISEALKRRFDFIDVLPPRPQLAESEQSIAINNALKRLNENRFQEISCSEVGKARYYKWKGVLEVQPAGDNSQRPQVRFPLAHAEAQSALSSFWRLFQAIRVFRKLGTAQAEAVYTNLFTGVLVGLDWPTALDVALADSLADQLQVLTPDEQLIIETFLLHAGESNLFVSKVNEQLKHVQRLRRPALVQALREADLMHNGKSDIDPQEIQHPTEVHLKRIFILGEGLALRPVSLFQQRLRDLNGERGL